MFSSRFLWPLSILTFQTSWLLILLFVVCSLCDVTKVTYTHETLDVPKMQVSYFLFISRYINFLLISLIMLGKVFFMWNMNTCVNSKGPAMLSIHILKQSSPNFLRKSLNCLISKAETLNGFFDQVFLVEREQKQIALNDLWTFYVTGLLKLPFNPIK